MRSAIYKGSDVRLATGSLQKPSGWPRRGVEAGHWKWDVCLSYPQRTTEHINVLELRALLATFRWRARRAQGLSGRVIHFCDSQVAIAVACKGRSSSRRLHRLLLQLSALLLATSCHPFYTFVRSAENPADRPSRWW